MASPILSIRSASISFAKNLLFEDLNLNFFAGDHICLIGKNGVGKSSLMNAIFGRLEFDYGERWIMPNARIGYLEQNEKMPPNLTVERYILQEVNLDDHKSYLIDMICQKLEIDKNTLTDNLSGGQKRRANLAKVLVLEPEILLLDEPTNHLDLNIIEWLEEYLANLKGALLVISHDRKFLEKISNKVFWLRAKTIKINHFGYKNFDEWSNAIIEHEERELNNLQKKVELESGWLQTGVTARRKRNIGRLHYLSELRAKLKTQKEIIFANQTRIKIHDQEDFNKDAPQVIASFNNVSKSYDDKKIVENFSLKILRGEKIGIIGQNGSGKSTFLKMLIGEVLPDQGTIKLAQDLQFSYFDQQRSAIKPQSTIKDILCPTGSDYVQLANEKTRHICGYLQDFLFDPKDTETLVDTLSGGQQNRLLLAKVLANPKNFLILDEPTNDLDMDSLDILQNYLDKYQGTVLIVSHDRDFLDQTATSILAFEGNARITSHIGGYSDYINYITKFDAYQEKMVISKNSTKIAQKPQKPLGKLKAELAKIPEKIGKIEQKIFELNDELINSEDRNPANLAQISIELARLQKEIYMFEARWIEIEEEISTMIN
ncbi:MAG TPA: ABC-F family ATP-binding cassette domain-containing protein [Rickettsiales bacterium]|nr:ABC-F family ATP-binding cassette domain-containing protein [Rickettsiales bacterium]